METQIIKIPYRLVYKCDIKYTSYANPNRINKTIQTYKDGTVRKGKVQ